MALSPLADLIGRVLADRYRLVAPIGNGASARVYLGDDTKLRRRVAVKVLHESLADDVGFLKRFSAEAHAAAVLNHPNVMHVYDSGTADGLPYLVCEYLAGGSLRAMLDRGTRLTPSQALVVGLETARGLEYAHRQGFVHRDIKPANLLFGEDGRLRIADFGLARAIAEAAWTEPQGMLLGTVRYAAPEQARGQSVDGRADVYSLTLALIEAVTGRVPFASDTTTATLMARCEHDIDVPEELGRLQGILARAGRLEVAERMDAGELELAFLAAAEDMDRPEPLPLAGALDVDDEELAAGAAAHPDELTIALPGATASVVDLTDHGARNATGAIDRANGTAGRSVIDIPLDSDPVAVGPSPRNPPTSIGTEPVVMTSRPRRRHRVRWAVLAVALLAAGIGGWAVFGSSTPTVPRVTGVDAHTAAARLKRWTVTTVLERQDGTKAGSVLSQSPRAGSALAAGHTVTLGISLGNSLVPLPKLASLSQADALAALKSAGLASGTITPQHDENVADGTVISSSAPVDASGQLPKGSTVDLVVSDGPSPRSVPAGIVGEDVDTARRQLAAVQLSLAEADEYNPAPAGQVLRSDQPDNAQVPRGTVVHVAVSKGPQPIPVPDVRNMSVTAASSALQAAGFTVSSVLGSPLNKVIATDPPTGEAHLPGTSVRLFTRS